ncbi:hypothetical protein [Bacillus paralicheniformis]|uniref:hypothetical protein n=1 Tax=Bacillus paralicheniformis TaxID=1648923 RepID=UPI0004723720|nr:hypothetical protein [Bacillus paralicheniformis]TWJ77719.1 hypothetical protein CHCC20497_2432 [Bacillus paralicheniformis]TWL49951.1 hypothetical protein CHCC15332_4240 [Bacillus paralicheniformis]TWN34840.1 hypothetical protein CHCC14527_0449 [Bacillus paralicheniformis]
MAKLEGVKTLDMVNGEITKVSYDGVEYERVEGEGKPGDIGLRISEPTPFVSLGHFYPITYGRVLSYIDDDGDLLGVRQRTFSFFRKVSSSLPTLEDRVSTNEKDIESLKSDVAALKGEAKTEYVRIDKSEAKAGDFVKFIETEDGYVTIGKLYEIEDFHRDADPSITDDRGDYNCASKYEVFEVYRKVSAADPKPERLKVGDYAKVVGNESGHYVEIDEIVLIKRDDKDFAPFHCEKLNGDAAGIFYEDELVRATDEEVAEAKDAEARAKFKKGAKVRLKSGGGGYPLLGFENGKVCTVIHNDYYHGDAEKKIQIECGCYYGYATPDQLVLLSEEEVTEIEKWDAIGREVGEYKVGDIVQYLYDGEICEVVDVAEDGSVKVATQKHGNCTENQSSIELIAPVEARFDRKGDE